MKNQTEPRSTSSCAACKFLKRKCTSNCQFSPYFRSHESKKFAKVHKVFGASNVSKILKEVPEDLREDTVNSLVYEAEVRLRDPVYGCIGAIASLQKKMEELQHDLILARARLAYCDVAANNSSSSSTINDRVFLNDHTLVCENEVRDFTGSEELFLPCFPPEPCIDGMLPCTEVLPLEGQSFDQNSSNGGNAQIGWIYDLIHPPCI